MRRNLPESPRTRGSEGSITVLAAICLVGLLGVAAFPIDWGFIEVTRVELQNAADAAAMAGARALPDGREAAITAASVWAGQNKAAGEQVSLVGNEDVEVGEWDEESGTFTALAAPSAGANAVRVTCRRTAERGNPLQLFLAPVIGTDAVSLKADAVAVIPGGGIGMRFLIDEEMIDKDVPSIEALASKTGMTPDKMLTARGFNAGKKYGDANWTWEDNFLDLPAGEKITVPTGQGTSYDSNDAGLLDTDYPQFPFSDAASLQQFLMYSETGNDSSKWGTDSSAVRSQLDPLTGVSPVWDDDDYADFVSPDFVHVSPVFVSDVSTLNMEAGVPRMNAKGLRRGLLAFKILEIGSDPDGAGSVLPNLVIEIVAPATTKLTDIKPLDEGGDVTAKLVE